MSAESRRSMWAEVGAFVVTVLLVVALAFRFGFFGSVWK